MTTVLDPALRTLTRNQLNTLEPLRPMIDGILDKGTVILLAAQPAAGKTFLAIDFLGCYITGKQWQGHNVDNLVTYGGTDKPEHGSVLYIAGEGARGFNMRLTAWEENWNHQIPNNALEVFPHPINLSSPIQVDALCAYLERNTFGLVIFDTLARCTVGLDENTAKDMGRVIDNVYKIREATGPDGTVIVIHHLGKNGEIRGSSSLEGGVDQVLRLEREGDYLTLRDTKRKDNIEFEPIDLFFKSTGSSRIITAGSGTEWHQTNPLVTEMNSLGELLPLTENKLSEYVGLPPHVFGKSLNRGLKSGDIVQSRAGKYPVYSLRQV